MASFQSRDPKAESQDSKRETPSPFEISPDNETVTLDVDANFAGTRLDSFLAEHIPEWSRARLQRLIESGDVLVNAKLAKASYKVSDGDKVEVELTPTATTDFVPENIPLDIVFEDDDLIVINKAAGLVVHPASGVTSGTLANGLAYHFQKLANAKSIRPGIVHRLDKDTSGLLVAAKSEASHQHLSDQFRAREVFKSYVTLAYGVVRKESGKIDQPIARDPRNRTRMAVVARGRGAVSLFKVRRSYPSFTLLDVELKTGRTHQIRVHLAWMKHPVVGDEVYAGGRENNLQDPQVRALIRKLRRQFLHAEHLSFSHPRTGQQMKFTAPLPPELEHFLQELEAH